jgi:hypothetical protein
VVAPTVNTAETVKIVSSGQEFGSTFQLTLDVVPSSDGSGRRGNDPWKLYRIGLFHFEKMRTMTTHSLVANETLLPFSRDSYIHPLYINNNLSV